METYNKKENKVQTIDTNIMQYKKENELIREEIENLKRELLISNQNIDYNKKHLEKINLNNNKIINDINEKLKEKNIIYENMKNNYDNIEKEIENCKNLEENKNDIIYKIKEQINSIQKTNNNTLKYYDDKFVNNIIIPDEYIHQILQKDILDFMNLVTYKISKIKPKVNELINFLELNMK